MVLILFAIIFLSTDFSSCILRGTRKRYIMDLKKILSKPRMKVVLETTTMLGKLKRVKCDVHVDSNDIADLDDAIAKLTSFRESLKTGTDK